MYVLEEPEAALSLRGCLALMRRMHELVSDGSQFVVASHSPIILGFPAARIHVPSDSGIHETPYEETEQTSSRGRSSTTGTASCTTCWRTSSASRPSLDSFGTKVVVSRRRGWVGRSP